jgi:hypothetical protein
MPTSLSSDTRKRIAWRPVVAAARSAWRESQPGLISEHLVFLDEPAIKTNVARTHALAPCGQLAIGAVAQKPPGMIALRNC